ncbi:hypothetical protein [Lactobacillus koreensis] [Lactiplantibacillus mudanjiangensis]|uniref:hypothetical protein n=1 Tax=Lactiplantibacillus mudanjiangensis TaxID=1296538 RepID=UPI001014295A|nr:hypothetical protein [Lactiplantibacillus mudanjiangensis]VDG20031.1 hypothetical protein [Lactobacillus koreensis] [Lactiplantibacillus mudanjiangensis]VDG33428.1 hypothetical protein [Lactobacillus koreensis] [Lactiplantibacillus mudanjiangensis]
MKTDAEIVEIGGELGLKLPAEIIRNLDLQVGQVIQVTHDMTNTLTLQDHDISPDFMRGVEAAVAEYRDALTMLRTRPD